MQWASNEACSQLHSAACSCHSVQERQEAGGLWQTGARAIMPASSSSGFKRADGVSNDKVLWVPSDACHIHPSLSERTGKAGVAENGVQKETAVQCCP